MSQGSDLGEAVEGTLPLRRVTGLVRLLMRAVLNEIEGTKKLSEPVFSEVFEDNLNVVARWFDFYIKAASWTYAFNPHESGDAPAIVAEHIYGLYLSGNKQLQSAMHASDPMIDLILAMWMSQDEKGLCHEQRSLRLTPQCPFVSLLVHFCSNHTSEPIIGTKISCFSRLKVQRFLQCSISRMERWKERRLQNIDPLPAEHLTHIIMLTNELLHSAGAQYRKAYFAAQFPSSVFELSKQFNPTKAPLGIAMASTFLSAVYKNSTDVRRRLILELLEKGLVNVLVAELLSQGRDSPALWKRWYPLGEETQTPLALLATVSFDKDVCESLSSAIGAIKETDVQRLRSSWAEKYWKPFAETIALYTMVWKHEVPEDGIAMCDNTTVRISADLSTPAILTEHVQHNHGSTVGKGDTKECSRCRTRVYCSKRCQRLDWDMVHRYECHAARAARIGTHLFLYNCPLGKMSSNVTDSPFTRLRNRPFLGISPITIIPPPRHTAFPA